MRPGLPFGHHVIAVGGDVEGNRQSEKRKALDIKILLATLLLLSLGLSVLHKERTGPLAQHIDIEQAPMSQFPTPPKQEAVVIPEHDQIKTDELYALLVPLFDSHSVEEIAVQLSRFDPQTIIAVLERIIEQQPDFNDRDRAELIITLERLTKDHTIQQQLFSFLSVLKPHEPLLYIGARSLAYRGLGAVRNWLQQRSTLEQEQRAALHYAIAHRDMTAFTRLMHYVGTMPPVLASELLFSVAHDNSDPAMVPPLVKHGADINGVYQGMTPLVAATKNNNLPLVKALFKHGADATKFGDPAVGTPLQVAIENQFVGIEQWLRDNGIKESVL